MQRKALNWKDFEQLHALVVGDVMIDRYLAGAVERISPEAPVPVVQLSRRESRLGGAGNVGLNIQAMGATAHLCSAVGADAAGEEFFDLMRAGGLSAEGILMCPNRITTTKTRVMAGAQHLLRVDEETTDDLQAGDEARLLDAVRTILDSYPVRVIIFQDYNKGTLTPALIDAVLLEARRRSIPTAVDPKEKNFWAYRGVTLFKPNLKEIRSQYPGAIQPDPESLAFASAYIRERLGNRISLITLSERGVFVEENGRGVLLPTHPRVIADVSGAGDTVVAVAALGLALGLPTEVLAALSNMAGGQVCEKPGVVSVDRIQLEEEYCRL